jgi:RNA recognition motif-containing protein
MKRNADSSLRIACSPDRLDVVAQKGNKMRGQAFVVFEEQSAATAAMRALVGEEFYGRPLVS